MLILRKASRQLSLLLPRISTTNGRMILMTGTTKTMMTGVLRTKMSGPKLQTTMMVATKLNGETGETGSSVAEGSPVAASTVTAAEAEAAVTGPTRMTDRATTATTMAKVATTSTRMAITRTDKVEATEVDGAGWTGPGQTAAAWTEEVQGVVREETHGDVVDSEEANQAKGYRPVVLGLSSSASEHTRHDRLNSQLLQHFG